MKRGRKPIDIATLSEYEFQWYKALHYLRDGLELPMTIGRKFWISSNLEWRRERLAQVKRMSTQEYWRDMHSVEIAINKLHPGREINFPLNASNRALAEKEQSQEIRWLERSLKPKQIYAAAERRDIWRALWRSRSPAALEEACKRWDGLRDVRLHGLQCWPAHVLADKDAFLRITRDKRFPKTEIANDDSRLDYIARGMAGAWANVSPLTAIERLRNMKHDHRGTFWVKEEQRCGCWRCNPSRFDLLYERIQQATLLPEKEETSREPF